MLIPSLELPAEIGLAIVWPEASANDAVAIECDESTGVSIKPGYHTIGPDCLNGRCP
jgi:hypothetical protein